MSKDREQSLKQRAVEAYRKRSQRDVDKAAKQFQKTFDVPLERIEVRENGVICADGLMFREDKPYKSYILVVECVKCGRSHNYRYFSDLKEMGRALENLGEGPFICTVGCREPGA